MVYQCGDVVSVTGYGGRTAILRVWHDHLRGVILTTEDGYRRLLDGCEGPRVGYPYEDIVEVVAQAEDVPWKKLMEASATIVARGA